MLEEEPQTWLDYLFRWLAYKGISNENLAKRLPLLLKKTTLDIYNTLDNATRSDLGAFQDAFKALYHQSDVQQLRGLSEIWQRTQKPSETVDQYVTEMQKMKRMYQNLYDENLRCALTLGFLPHIRRHVIKTNAGSLKAVLTAKRIAEQAAIATDSDDRSMQAALTRIEQRLINSNSQRSRSLSPITKNSNQNRFGAHSSSQSDDR